MTTTSEASAAASQLDLLEGPFVTSTTFSKLGDEATTVTTVFEKSIATVMTFFFFLLLLYFSHGVDDLFETLRPRQARPFWKHQ